MNLFNDCIFGKSSSDDNFKNFMFYRSIKNDILSFTKFFREKIFVLP